ncbi:bacterial proteasome activator family protein [Nocardioides sp. T5]|uniref:bacterial proteasome activator family protein n=2 Tax=Nocardioides TaxID=1839 RepID=UPI003A83B324
MTEQQQPEPTDGPSGQGADEDQVVVLGPDGQPIGTIPASALPAMTQVAGAGDDEDGDGERHITELVEQPAKVMRIGSMIRQLLEEVKAAPLDEASRNRLKDIHAASIKELETGLAPELVEELERLSLPFTEDGTPSEGELRIAQAQLVGWLEGLFHGIQTAIYAQQMASRAQLEQMRRALPAGHGGHPAQGPHQPTGMPTMPGSGEPDDSAGSRGGMYL